MANDNKRLNILLSAYACEPDKGSEPGVGWNWAVHLSKKYNVYVITRTNNKESIEKYMASHGNEHLHFFFYDCSPIIKKMKKILPGGIFIYYRIWQKNILSLAKFIVKEYNIDIVHHITFNEYRTPGVLYKLNKPFVWGPIGGGQFYNPVTKNAYFRKSDIVKERLRNMVNRLHLIFSMDIKNAIKKSAAILIADQSTERIMPKCRSYYRLLETAYNTERNGIKAYNTHTGDIKLLWVGGIFPRKGLKILIDALGESSFQNYQLMIVGDGKDRKLCEALVKKYGIENRVFFKGALSYIEVNNLYDFADVFIFTSLRDTSGNVVLEAMSHGLPVIAFKHHGVGEIVTEETGELISIIEYEQLKKSLINNIVKYYNNPLLIEQKGKMGRNRIETVYSWPVSINFIDCVYKEVLED
jgi:glycosyltransferase involved in cell wall biosynthesis